MAILNSVATTPPCWSATKNNNAPKKKQAMNADNHETTIAESRELYLWATNDKHTYTHLLCAHLNLLDKVKKGKYDSSKAVRLMEYVAGTAAKTYAKAFCCDTNWYDVFPPAIRKICAVSLVKDFEAENDIA